MSVQHLGTARTEQSFIRRHETLTLVLLNALALVMVIGLGEIVARAMTNYSIGYYTDTRSIKDGVKQYPWGEIPVNSLGFNDEEFDLDTTKPRVGWFGDFVAMGLGAGFPYRISDIARKHLPDVASWNIGGHFGGELDEQFIIDEAARFHLKHAVYVMNLNDITPAIGDELAGRSLLYYTAGAVRASIDYLRDRSFLYNRVRTSIKNALQRLGFEASGYYAYELWPNRSEAVFRHFAGRVNALAQDLQKSGVQLCVVISPYEMQVSKDAARTYSELGFSWEDGFAEGSAQKKMRAYLDKTISVYDGLDAFPDKSAKVGHYFVYNEGDKVDWNHPNRAGHAAFAEGFLKSNACPFLKTN